MHRSVGVVVLFALLSVVSARKGVIELDKDNYDKIIDGSKNVLVQFSEYSWKDSAAIEAVSEEFASRMDLLIAKLATHDAPAELKTRLGITSNDPFVRFFGKGATAGIDFIGDLSATNKDASKEIIQFVHNILSPQMQELKKLAERFVATPTRELVSEATLLTSQLDKQYTTFGEGVLKTMAKIQEKGPGYAAKEYARLLKMMNSKSTKKDKQKDFSTRLSYIELFVSAEEKTRIIAATPKPPPSATPPPVPPPGPPKASHGPAAAAARAKAAAAKTKTRAPS